MKKEEKFQPERIGRPEYVNKNCWLVKNLNYSSSERCRYCESKFRGCLFFQYLIVSLTLVSSLSALFFFIEGRILKLEIVSIFVLVVVYGYFFSRSTEKIIKANFAQIEAKQALEKLAESLTEKVNEQTKEIRRAYEVEKKAHRELQHLDEAKTQFMMATQHHLRTPLTAILGYLELIHDGVYGKVCPEMKGVCSRIRISASRLNKIVNELLDVSQFQLGKKVVALQPDVKLEPILNEIVEELQFEVAAKKLELKFQKPVKLAAIKADPEKLKVALTNVIDNAIKYTQAGGVIIKAETRGDKVLISVKDTGVGLAKGEEKNLFNRIFERNKQSQATNATGKGIGMYITSHIIQAHNGRIWAESEGEGKGTTFFVELPR